MTRSGISKLREAADAVVVSDRKNRDFMLCGLRNDCPCIVRRILVTYLPAKCTCVVLWVYLERALEEARSRRYLSRARAITSGLFTLSSANVWYSIVAHLHGPNRSGHGPPEARQNSKVSARDVCRTPMGSCTSGTALQLAERQNRSQLRDTPAK